MKKKLCYILSVVFLLCFTVSAYAISFDSPLPTFTLFAEQYPATFLHITQQIDDFSMQIEPPQHNVTAELILDMLQDTQCYVDIIFLETDMEGYSNILNSGLCSNLSGTQYLLEYLEQMPSVLSSLCYHNDIPYAFPVCLNLPANSSITCYNDLASLSALPDGVSLTVAILNQNSPNRLYSPILLNTLYRYADSYTQALFFAASQ